MQLAGERDDFAAFITSFINRNGVRHVVEICASGKSAVTRSEIDTSVIYTQIDIGTPFGGAGNIGDLIVRVGSVDLVLITQVLETIPNEIVLRWLHELRSKARWLLLTYSDQPFSAQNKDIPFGGYRPLRLDGDPFFERSTCLFLATAMSDWGVVRHRTDLVLGDWLRQAPRVKDGLHDCFIPKRIFQTWKSKVDLPQSFDFWSRTIRDKNPAFSHVIADDGDNEAFIKNEFGWFYEKYRSFDLEIMRVDAVRYFQLFMFGGFYIDMDVECLRPLDVYLDVGDVILGRMGPNAGFAHSIPNAIMASRPRQEFWLYVFHKLLTGPSTGYPEEVTGPVMLKSCIDEWHDRRFGTRISRAIADVASYLPKELSRLRQTSRIVILPSREWYSLDWSDPVHQMVRARVLERGLLAEVEKAQLFPEATLVTYWAHSW
jgi:inositol phosphorylceramide mannosyltransferase catalytic subunit